ncbi:formyltransferase family protein [Georgenia sp. 10Sc9-8]|uniref:Formyltransferase family protein n=1 Tax=Georgenia halotolerans TaxID=3028317 RepID=A0ABT5TZJ5_9MICO|nr:formyltransferase family protein [Georgenia halotolerans]
MGLSVIEEILDIGGRLDLLVTLEDHLASKKSGRVYLDKVSAEHGVPLRKVSHINDDNSIQAIAEAELDWLFIVGWSQIAGPRVLEAPKEGVLGMHPTLLPVGRGRAAVPWAILKGLESTGVTLFKLDEGVDTGPVLAQEVIELDPGETASTLYTKVEAAHVVLVRRVWPDLLTGDLRPQPQDESMATVWPGRSPEDGAINATDMTVAEVDRLVRAVTAPYPGAFAEYADGTRVRVWRGRPGPACGEGIEFRMKDGLYTALEVETEAGAQS